MQIAGRVRCEQGDRGRGGADFDGGNRAEIVPRNLAELLEKQVRAAREAKEEYKKIEDARKRMNSLKIPDLFNQKKESSEKGTSDLVYKSETSRKEVSEAIESLQEKIKEQLDGNSIESLTVTQLVEKIDGLVNKVVNMETTVSTQTILIDRLRGEAVDFQKRLRTLRRAARQQQQSPKKISPPK